MLPFQNPIARIVKGTLKRNVITGAMKPFQKEMMLLKNFAYRVLATLPGKMTRLEAL
jgi:hypothetical protein